MMRKILLALGRSALLIGAVILTACGRSGSPKINIDTNAVGNIASLNQFVEGVCIIPMGKGVRCGYVHVPENRSNSDSRIIKIAVAVLPSQSKSPEPDPVVVLSGGPGYPLIARHEDIPKMLAAVIANRDIILVDQRGIGFSTPRMSCSEFSLETAFVPKQKEMANIKACHDRLVTGRADLNGYTTRESAADFATIRQALGYEEWNILGASYGVELGMEIMKNHPNGLRSVILDSAMPPHINAMEEKGGDILGLIEQLIDNCSADEKCLEKHPDLLSKINSIAHDLDGLGDQSPASILDLIILLGGDISDPKLLDMVEDLAQGKYPKRGRGRRGKQPEDISGTAMAVSIACSGDAAYADFNAYSEIENKRLSPLFYEALDNMLKAGKEMCSIWDVKPVIGAKDKFTSDVPALVMASDIDSSTPIQWSRETMQYLNNGHIVELTGLGHVTFFSRSPCPTTIMAKFLDDPNAKFKAADIKSCKKMFLTER